MSGLTYNYDGVTDGHNDDLPGATVPEPASVALLAVGLLGVRLRRRVD